MRLTTPRARISARILLAYLAGVIVASLAACWDIGTFKHVDVALFTAGLTSLPWLILLSVIIWFFSEFIDRRPVYLVVLGPIFVVVSWYLIAGLLFLVFVAIACLMASITYFWLTLYSRRTGREAS